MPKSKLNDTRLIDPAGNPLPTYDDQLSRARAAVAFYRYHMMNILLHRVCGMCGICDACAYARVVLEDPAPEAPMLSRLADLEHINERAIALRDAVLLQAQHHVQQGIAETTEQALHPAVTYALDGLQDATNVLGERAINVYPAANPLTYPPEAGESTRAYLLERFDLDRPEGLPGWEQIPNARNLP